MFWIRSGLQGISIFSDWLLSGPSAPTAAEAPVANEPSHTLEEARAAMFEALGEAGDSRRATLLLRIRQAADARSLWELRPAVMEAVARLHGEWEGRRRIAQVTEKFEGLLPHARAALGRDAFGASAR
jgi:hypothetical protein